MAVKVYLIRSLIQLFITAATGSRRSWNNDEPFIAKWQAGCFISFSLSLSLYYLSISLYICFSNSAYYPLMIYFVSSTLSILSFFPLLHYYKHFFLWSFFFLFFWLVKWSPTHIPKRSPFTMLYLSLISFPCIFFFYN